MAQLRKTLHVADIIVAANRLLEAPNSKHCTPEFRKGVAALLEGLLHDSNAYAGYNFLAWAKEGGYEKWVKDGGPRDNEPYLGDQTRRFYYKHRLLETKPSTTVPSKNWDLAYPLGR